ncbi:quinone oxidoreductase family protein [Blastococcus sp. PRF04-17]|uniref:quinone oxidoreductase family protein n=1 Tax=Blastococcus sp. PRF04-17 TaxID=2933797 RepID=UPI001FF62A04|nr:quinone oxidoreductase [Blastococcus sp. PRF04-17]UOX99932.1 quinone oxidoreductase [Blastococcus sp. PRF04-17]
MVQSVMVGRTGGPEVLELRDSEQREPGPGELLVDVEAAGVNFIDVYQREGRYPMDLPFVAGCEGAGTVRAVGPDVDLRPGARVAWAMVNGTGYTQRAVVPADRVVPVPDGVTTEQAAAVLLQGVTAQFLCTSTCPVQAGDQVLVHAAAGGVGLLLTQMAAGRGARVIGTVSTDEKARLARAAGAVQVVRYDHEDVVERVRELTGGRGVRVVYDGVGQATFDASLACLAPLGTLALFGASSGAVPPVDPMRLAQGGSLFLTRPTLATYVADRPGFLERAADVFEQVRSGALDVRIGGRYPLADASRAHADLEARRTSGKSLIIPA